MARTQKQVLFFERVGQLMAEDYAKIHNPNYHRLSSVQYGVDDKDVIGIRKLDTFIELARILVQEIGRAEFPDEDLAEFDEFLIEVRQKFEEEHRVSDTIEFSIVIHNNNSPQLDFCVDGASRSLAQRLFTGMVD